MLTVPHLGVSQSERIVWLCEELGIPYELKRYDRDPVTRMGPPEYKALHPVGTAPIITDGEESPRARFMRERAEKSWELVEQRLGKAPYFAGDDFSAADIIMVFPLTT